MNPLNKNLNMKKIMTAALLFAATFFSSCLDEHIDPMDLSLKVGNIYCENGAIYPYDYYVMQDSPAAGVVTSVGGKDDGYRALVVALDDAGPMHYLNDTKSAIQGVSSDLTTFDGKENTASLLLAVVNDSTLIPGSAILCSTYLAGGAATWHLPSVAEFRSVADNYAAVSTSLDKVKAQPLGNRYQTSTMDGTSSNNAKLYNYLIELPKGNVSSVMRTESHPVRPFLILK